MHLRGRGGAIPTGSAVAAVLDVVIGAVTFSGSLIAAGKLQGIVSGRPIVFPGVRALNVALGRADARRRRRC